MDADFIVVGAGVNGLAAAATLARAGRRGVILERRGTVGGLASEGDKPGILRDTGRIHPGMRAALLPDLPMRQAHPITLTDGRRLDEERSVIEWRASLDPYRKLAEWMMNRPAPRLLQGASSWEILQGAVRFRILGAKDALELLRIGTLPAEDWLSPQIPDPQVRAALMLDGLLGTWLGPQSPGTAATLLWDALGRSGSEVLGGGPALIAALLARLDGVQIRTEAPVAEILVEAGQVRGVRLEEGEILRSPCVISAVDPRQTVLDLLDPLRCPPKLEADASAHRCRGTHAILHLRWDETPPARRLRMVDGPIQLEKAADAVKYGELAADPPLDLWLDETGGLALIFGAPFDLRGGWTPDARARLTDLVTERISARGLTIREATLLAPPDLQAAWGCTGGHLFHGEHALDQLWLGRPSLSLSGHRTPIEGLWLASMGTHPGGGVTGGPGWLAARAVLEAR